MVDEDKNLSLIEQANMAALRLEQANMVLLEANKTKELLLKKEEELLNNRLLGGKSSGQTVQAAKVETPQEYAMRVMRGGL